jgi:Fe-S-cluster containining protein
MPVFHDCQRCTACCRWPGQVRLTDAEITRIAGFLQLGQGEFIQRHTRLRADRRGLALQEQPDGACIFLQENLCTIQAVKPQQCRDFPNLWKYPDAEKYCRAIPRTVSAAEYVRLVAQATQREPESVREIMRHTRSETPPEAW